MRICTALLTAALVLSVGAFSGSVAGASETGGKTKTTTITLDNYCNVFTLSVFAWHQAGSLESGCDTNVGAGMEGKVKGIKPSDLTIVENPNVNGEVYLWNIQYPLKTGNSWSVYSTTDGVNFEDINNGTYTVTNGPAALPRSGPRADHKQAVRD